MYTSCASERGRAALRVVNRMRLRSIRSDTRSRRHLGHALTALPKRLEQQPRPCCLGNVDDRSHWSREAYVGCRCRAAVAMMAVSRPVTSDTVDEYSCTRRVKVPSSQAG